MTSRRPAGASAAPVPAARPSARRVAYECLLRVDHDGAYANLVVGPALERSGLDARDRAFATDLVYGTTRMRRACDALVDRFVSSEPRPEVRTLLRLGAYQLHMVRTPPHAAVQETVALAPRAARGFVNAVLRRVAATPMVWPDPAVRLSYPDWIVQRLTAELGEAAALGALEAMDRPPPVTARDDGYVQDRASQWVAAAVPAHAGDVVLDVCAAPGGKASAVAARGAYVVAADLRPHRARLVAGNFAGLGSTGAVVAADGLHPPFAEAAFDHVLVDAPCSGLGTLRRRPAARWRIGPDDVTDLAALQGLLLRRAAPLVRPGGTLTYSVCTLTAAESVDHATPPGFDVIGDVPGPQWEAFRQGFRVLPQNGDTDGMVLVRYRRHA